MTTKKDIDKVDNGTAVIINKSLFQWSVGIIITIMIFLLTQTYVFGNWQGNIETRVKTIETQGTDISRANEKKMNTLLHNQRRMMEKLGIAWEDLDVK